MAAGDNTAAAGARTGGGPGALPSWPAGQQIRQQGQARTVLATRFEDWERYHRELVEAILGLARDQRFACRYIAAFGGIKVETPERWSVAAADLVCRRAMAFCAAALDVPGPRPFESWANVYGAGDYAMPHSHPEAGASLLYVVDTGVGAAEAAAASSASDPLGGMFAIVDPRYPPCCERERGFLTNPVMPKLVPGMMLLFPGWLVHAVNPHRGTRPRITMTWNVRLDQLPGALACPE
jgi:hypothetical protein